MSSSSHLDKIKKLRELTGVGFGDCNTAISECGGDDIGKIIFFPDFFLLILFS